MSAVEHTLKEAKRIDKLIQNAPVDKKDVPCVLERQVVKEVYNELLLLDHRYPGLLDLRDGNLMLVDYPDRLCLEFISEISTELYRSLKDFVVPKGCGAIRSMRGGPSMEASLSFCPATTPPPGVTKEQWVTLVVEVGLFRDMESLVAKAQRWLTETTCNTVVVFKLIQKKTTEGEIVIDSVEATIFDKGNADPVSHVKYFAYSEANSTGSVVDISLDSVFGSPEKVPASLRKDNPGGNISVDLFYITQRINKPLVAVTVSGSTG